MKRTVFFTCLLVAALLAAAQQSASFVQDNIKKVKERLGDRLLTTADAVVARHVEAIGGRAAVLSVKTMMVKGRNVRFGQGDIPYYRYLKQPGLVRAMRSPEDKSYTLSDGNKTWSVTPAGRKEQSEWWAVSLRHERIDGNFVDYKERGIRYEYIGLEGFASEPFVYYHLRRTFADGYVEDLYFDVDSGLLHGVWPTSSPRKDSPMFYYDYRKVGGILFPYAWMRVHDKTSPPHLFLVEEVKTNEEFGEDFFR